MLTTPVPLALLVQRRLLKYVHEWEPFLDRVAWTKIGDLLSLVPMSWAMPVIKTYCSGWLTASRIKYAGGSRPCIFGCRGHADRQCHYMRCRPLWTAVYQASIGI
eukprot:1053118-Pyramimonas_sp.AAC.1